MHRYIGRDPMGIKRIWGEGETAEEAHRQASDAANAYVSRRPDCWPITIEKVPDDELAYYP